ncbi:MAG: MmcQ/YjbR family DNA-binding protein [Gemmatimonadales bacterium]
MTAAQFRRLALSIPDAVEAGHHGHPDFRVRGKIFATLGYPGEGWAMVKLTPEDQEFLVRSDPAAFQPVKGAWGKAGCTNVLLRSARTGPVRDALRIAWETAVPRRSRR